VCAQTIRIAILEYTYLFGIIQTLFFFPFHICTFVSRSYLIRYLLYSYRLLTRYVQSRYLSKCILTMNTVWYYNADEPRVVERGNNATNVSFRMVTQSVRMAQKCSSRQPHNHRSSSPLIVDADLYRYSVRLALKTITVCTAFENRSIMISIVCRHAVYIIIRFNFNNHI